MKYEEALRKAISCLKLARSTNPAEAALAAAKAQEIIDRYNLSVGDLQNGEGPKENDEPIANTHDPLHHVCQVDTRWSVRLASCIAKKNACRVVFYTQASGSAIIQIIGRTSDVNAVRYLFGWMESEVRRLTKQECQGRSRKYQVDFRYGVVDTIERKLDEQRRETFKAVQTEVAGNPMALMRVRNSIAKVEQRGNGVDLWMKSNMSGLRTAKHRKQLDVSARVHGMQAGEVIKLNNAKASLGSASERLEYVA